MELVNSTGRSKEAVSKTLRQCLEQQYITKENGRRGFYCITDRGRQRLAILSERRTNRCIYDHEILPKLYHVPILTLNDIPPPDRYRVRLWVDDSLEEDFREERRHYVFIEEGYRKIEDITRRSAAEDLRVQTVDGIAQYAVNTLIWETIINRLCGLLYIAKEQKRKITEKDIKEVLGFSFTLTINYENRFNEESREVLVALLGLFSIRCNLSLNGISILDILKELTELGYGNKEISKLAEKIHLEKRRRKRRKISISSVEEDKQRLFELCMDILKKHKRVANAIERNLHIFEKELFEQHRANNNTRRTIKTKYIKP